MKREIGELSQFTKDSIDRELQMVELKKRIKELERRLESESKED